MEHVFVTFLNLVSTMKKLYKVMDNVEQYILNFIHSSVI